MAERGETGRKATANEDQSRRVAARLCLRQHRRLLGGQSIDKVSDEPAIRTQVDRESTYLPKEFGNR